MSLACAFCKSNPFAIPFAPDGSKVHELEHEAGGVNWLDIASVVIVSVSVALATSVGFVDVILNVAAKVRGMEYAGRIAEGYYRIVRSAFWPPTHSGGLVGLKYYLS